MKYIFCVLSPPVATLGQSIIPILYSHVHLFTSCLFSFLCFFRITWRVHDVYCISLVCSVYLCLSHPYNTTYTLTPTVSCWLKTTVTTLDLLTIFTGYPPLAKCNYYSNSCIPLALPLPFPIPLTHLCL